MITLVWQDNVKNFSFSLGYNKFFLDSWNLEFFSCCHWCPFSEIITFRLQFWFNLNIILHVLASCALIQNFFGHHWWYILVLTVYIYQKIYCLCIFYLYCLAFYIFIFIHWNHGFEIFKESSKVLDSYFNLNWTYL